MKTKMAFAMIMLVFAIPSFARQTVSGIIDHEVRWKAEDGPYIVEGDILITRRGNLVIAPGTEIVIAANAQKKNLAVPFDRIDETLVSIRVQGSLNCVGWRDNPIIFRPEVSELANFTWRGIIVDEVGGRHTEIAFTSITGAATGLTIRNSDILVRNSAFENCNIGIHTRQGGAPRIFNNLITNCFTAGIKIERANPQIINNIIAFNNHLGMFCDNSSRIIFSYNCVFGNGDRNFLDCDPELGIITRPGRGNKNTDSTDVSGNLMANPVFIGSSAEARAMEIDINLQTDTSKVTDRRLLNIPNFQFGPTIFNVPTYIGSEGRQLSTYSPCINAGDPAGRFKNVDGSRNTMGPLGGPDVWK